MNSLTLRPGSRASKRDEAAALPSLLEFHSPTAALAVAPIQGGARAINLIICTLVAACFLAGGLIPVDKVVTATGKVVAEQASSVVQPLETSIVRSIDVREGQLVKKGALLARLDPTFAAADVGSLQASVDSLQMEVDRLVAEQNGADFKPDSTAAIALLQRATFIQRRAERTFKLEGYTQKISSLQAQLRRAMSDINGYGQRLAVAKTLESKRLELERDKVGSAINSLAAIDSRLEVQRGLDSAHAAAEQGARDLAAMQAERDGYEQSNRSQIIQELTDQSRKLSDARGNLEKALRRQQLVELRASADSIVLNISKVSPGSVMQSGEQLMSTINVDAPLEIEVNVAGSDAGFVHPGNTVTVKLDAFPFTQYGYIDGIVRTVSADSFVGQQPDQPQRGVQQMPQNGTSYYRVRITMDEDKLHDLPPGFHKVPGMPVTADVKVGKRTVLSYLFSRVLPVAMDGMREP